MDLGWENDNTRICFLLGHHKVLGIRTRYMIRCNQNIIRNSLVIHIIVQKFTVNKLYCASIYAIVINILLQFMSQSNNMTKRHYLQ